MNEKRTWESDMSDAFDRRVRDLHEAPLSFEQVTTRARGIRRRRQAAVAGGVLAVAAVIAPIAVVVGGDAGRGDDVPAATDAPTPTVTDSSPALPDNGPNPGIGRIQDDEFIRGDGVEFDLPGTGYQRADQLGEQIVAYRRDDEGNGTIDVVTAPPEGGTTELVESLPAVDGYVADPMGLVIAYKTPEGELMTRWDGDGVSFGSDFPESAYPAAITGGPNCNEEVDGCVVYLNIGDGNQAPVSVSSHGTLDTPIPGIVKINDVDAAGVAAVQISYSDTGSCSGLYDPTAGDYLFETCENTLGAISPSGGHVIAGPAYLDGIGPSSIAILDRDGVQVAGNQQEGGFIGSQAWEDPGHVVYTVYTEDGWSIWRMGIDGTVEQITDPVPGDEVDPPILLAG